MTQRLRANSTVEGSTHRYFANNASGRKTPHGEASANIDQNTDTMRRPEGEFEASSAPHSAYPLAPARNWLGDCPTSLRKKRVK